MAKKTTVKNKVVEPVKVPTKPVAQEQPTIEVPKENVIHPDAPSTWPQQPSVENPEQLDPDLVVNPDEEGTRIAEAKEKFGALYLRWNKMSPEEQESGEGQDLAEELGRLHQVINPKLENPDESNPQASINNPETSHETNPGEGNPAELHPVTDSDYVDQTGTEHAEQVVEKAGRPAGFNEFYHGDHLAKPENDLIYHMPADEYDANKNKENR